MNADTVADLKIERARTALVSNFAVQSLSILIDYCEGMQFSKSVFENKQASEAYADIGNKLVAIKNSAAFKTTEPTFQCRARDVSGPRCIYQEGHLGRHVYG